MRLIVQKYGGTSVGTPERIRNVARRLVETQREGCSVVAVISAMAGVTDDLIKLAHEMSPDPTKRELDILLATGEHAASALTAMAVNALGAKAISLTGAEAGILTDPIHTKAKIANISPKQIQELLAEDYIVIVAGFQGQSAEGETTTLGRGGSDLTAVALAGALNADTTSSSRWRAPVQKSCNRARLSSLKNSGSNSRSGRVSAPKAFGEQSRKKRPPAWKTW